MWNFLEQSCEERVLRCKWSTGDPLLPALGVQFKLQQLPRKGQHPEGPCTPAPALQLWKIAFCPALSEGWPQALGSGCQSWGHGSHFLEVASRGSLGNTPVLPVVLAAGLKGLDLCIVFEKEDWGCQAAHPLEPVWFEQCFIHTLQST